MDFQTILQVASKKQEKTEKQKNPAKAAREKYKSQVNSENVKNFLQRQKEEEKRKQEEEKKKRLELLNKRVEANTKKKPVETKPKVDKEMEIFDMNDEEAEKAKKVVLKKQTSEEFKGLKTSDFDFETKKDRKARAPNDAALAAKQRLEQIKAKMKGVNVHDRMAEIDKELSDDEKKPKSKSSDKDRDRDRHSSSSKDKHRDKHKHRDDKHRSKHSSSSHKSKHEQSSSYSKSSSKPFSSSKQNVSDSDSDISDISLEEVKPTAKTQSWVSVKKTSAPVEKPKPKVNRPKSAAPPPVSFQELMAMAEQKKSEPVSIKPLEARIPKKKREDRPMTQEEKDRMARIQTPEYQAWLKTGKRPVPKPIDRSSLAPHPTRPGTSANEAKPKPVVPHPTRPAGKVLNGDDKQSRNGVASSSSNKVPGYRESPKLERSTFMSNNNSSRESSKTGQNRESSKNGQNRESIKNSQNRESSKNGQSRESSKNGQNRESSKSSSKPKDKSQDNTDALRMQLQEMEKKIREQQEMYDKLMKQAQGQESSKASPKPSSSKSSSSSSRPEASSSKHKPTSSSSSSKNGIVGGSKRPKHDMSDEEEPPVKKKPPPPPQPYTNPFDRIMGKYQERNPKPKPKPKPQRIEDDYDEYDDEYDSEMDDFIDDGDDGVPDYSKHIRGIFGYDKRKFRNERDDDLRSMEANFAEISREEARSARIGMKEDLEDIKREEEELKRKKKKQ